jgi:hypothetical protein
MGSNALHLGESFIWMGFYPKQSTQSELEPASNTNTPSNSNAQSAQEPQVSPSSASDNPQEPVENPQAEPIFAPYDADTQGVG